MLQSLLIKNYVIIDHVDLKFAKGLNIITGETGAGKSILLGALQLILGKRADLNALFDVKKKCIIEGVIAIQDYGLESLFSSHELEYDDELIIRREISPSGKSRAFVNDSPVNLSVLNEISAQLIDLHQQFDTLDIYSNVNQYKIVDTLANSTKLLDKYQTAYKSYKEAKEAFDRESKEAMSASKEIDYIQFQLQELDKLQLISGEQEKMEEELAGLENAEEIKLTINEIAGRLNGDQQSVIQDLEQATRQLMKLNKYNSSFGKLADRLHSTSVELTDINEELISISGDSNMDPEKLSTIKGRLDDIYRLQKKHGVLSVTELLDVQEKLRIHFDNYSNVEGYLATLNKKVEEEKAKASKLALDLFKKRKGVTSKIEKEIGKRLSELAMPDARLTLLCEENEELNSFGKDSLAFLFSANKGKDAVALKKVASGGELSRLNLSLKALVANKMDLPCLVFDEIDTGISGEVAHRMGLILEELGSAHQVIVITHSPQVAAKGDRHLLVYKETKAKTTNTYIRELEVGDRIVEIAKMLSGDPPSEPAKLNAKELLKL
jgi:DNA repair protein RecN (Recombination protein N)